MSPTFNDCTRACTSPVAKIASCAAVAGIVTDNDRVVPSALKETSGVVNFLPVSSNHDTMPVPPPLAVSTSVAALPLAKASTLMRGTV